MAEFEFIDWLRDELTRHPPNQRLLLPPGDDCALLAPAPQGVLFAADMLMDGVHFRLADIDPQLIGRKALAVNLSDIAAMAGTPTSVTVTLALPRQHGEALARQIMLGMLPLARRCDVAIAGGDTNTWDGPLVISVAITGTPHVRGSVERRGAKPGDWICVTGALGGSIQNKHLLFEPRVKEARELHQTYGLTAMLDLSDGLASDLRHILRASQVGATLVKSRIPISPAAQQAATQGGASALERAVGDGEDFELCFTLSPSAGAALLAAQPFGAQLPIHHIGLINAASGLLWSDGTAVASSGWSHQWD